MQGVSKFIYSDSVSVFQCSRTFVLLLVSKDGNSLLLGRAVVSGDGIV